MVAVLRDAGADNVTWLRTIHHSGNAARLRAYWPGSHHVTWVGIDGYYEFPGSTFSQLFGRPARAVRTFTRKPTLASERAGACAAGCVRPYAQTCAIHSRTRALPAKPCRY